jgi:hypothetical protein
VVGCSSYGIEVGIVEVGLELEKESSNKDSVRGLGLDVMPHIAVIEEYDQGGLPIDDGFGEPTDGAAYMGSQETVTHRAKPPSTECVECGEQVTLADDVPIIPD